MPGTYKMIEVVGTSEDSFAEAVRNAVKEASRTVRHMDWFEVANMRGAIDGGDVTEYQVTVKIGFKIEGNGGDDEEEEAPPVAPRKRGKGR